MIRAQSLLALLASTVVASEVGHEVPFTYALEQNATAAREYRGDIPTVFWDLRLGLDVCRSGLPLPWPHATVAVEAVTKRYYWSDSSLLVNPPGSAYTPFRSKAPEDRVEYQLSYTQSLWTPFPWDAQLEIQAGASKRELEVQRAGRTTTYSDSFLVSDPRAILLLPVWQERYAGVLLGGGVLAPAGEESDWVHAHGHVGWLATARWSGVLPLVPCTSFQLAGTYVQVPNAQNAIYTVPAAGTTGGFAPGRVTVDHDYSCWEIGAAAWYRPWTHLAVGAVGSFERHIYQDGATSTGLLVTEEHIITSNVGPALRLSWKRAHLTMAITTDILTNADQDHAWQAACSLEIGTW